MSIPQNASVHRGSGIQSYTGDIDYYLRRKSHDYEDAGNIDLAVLCLKKSNEIRMFCRNGYRRDDYYTLVRLLARCGRVDEARAEKEKIDRFFDTLDDETNDSYALDYSFIVRRVVNAAKSFNTDLVIMSVHGNACPECAKYQGRVFSLSGKDRRFPKIPDVFWKYGGIHPGCGHSFYPFIYGVTDGDMSYTLSVQKISNRKYAKNIVAFSNRPFVDDPPAEGYRFGPSAEREGTTGNRTQTLPLGSYDRIRSIQGCGCTELCVVARKSTGYMPKITQWLSAHEISEYEKLSEARSRRFGPWYHLIAKQAVLFGAACLERRYILNCIKCRAELPDGAQYCPQCGKKQMPTQRRTAKRANGTGSVYKLAGHRKRPWVAMKNRVIIGYYQTKKNAIETLEQLAGRDINERYNMTFADVYNAWKAEHYQEIGPGGIASYARAFDVFAALHDRQFRTLRTADYQTVMVTTKANRTAPAINTNSSSRRCPHGPSGRS